MVACSCIHSIWGWSLACPSDSRLRRGYDGLEYGALPSGPSFVQNHIRTMDMCANPEWQYMHGEGLRLSPSVFDVIQRTCAALVSRWTDMHACHLS